MKNWHAVLGVANNASQEDVVKAYRKMAMLHHPDRGGDQEKFKAIKEAYEMIEANGFRPFVAPSAPPPRPPSGGYGRPESPGNTWRDQDIGSIFEDLKKHGRGRAPPQRNYAYVQPDAEIVAKVGIRDAFNGFVMPFSRQGPSGSVEHLSIKIRGGMPDGHRGKYKVTDDAIRAGAGSSLMQTVVMNIDGGDFRIRGINGENSTILEPGVFPGDVEIEINVDAIDLITGNWIKVKDFLGEELTVRIPAGFNPLQRLKVANKGYYGWASEYQIPTTHRRDMYIKINPIFQKPDAIDRQKILNLYNSVEWNEKDES